MTELQRTITKEHLIHICKLMHHSLTEEQLSKIKWYFKYTWVCIEFRVKGYGYISIGLDNHHSGIQLTGNKVTMDDIQAAINRRAIDLRIWRFVDDETYKREQQAADFFKFTYKQPTAKEFYNNYYSD